MQRFTQRVVCVQKVPSAFVTLGGEIQYRYMSVDGHPIVAPSSTTAAKVPLTLR
jgi:hypothetical protein